MQWYRFQTVWWSVSEKTHFGLKHHFPLYLEGQTLHTLRFSGMLNHNGTSFKAVWWSCFWENTFWPKTSLYFVLSSPNTEHPDGLRHVNHNGTSFKAVWWSVSDKTHFGLKHHFPLYLEGHPQCTLMFLGVPITMVLDWNPYDDPFLRKHIFG